MARSLTLAALASEVLSDKASLSASAKPWLIVQYFTAQGCHHRHVEPATMNAQESQQLPMQHSCLWLAAWASVWAFQVSSWLCLLTQLAVPVSYRQVSQAVCSTALPVQTPQLHAGHCSPRIASCLDDACMLTHRDDCRMCNGSVLVHLSHPHGAAAPAVHMCGSSTCSMIGMQWYVHAIRYGPPTCLPQPHNPCHSAQMALHIAT